MEQKIHNQLQYSQSATKDVSDIAEPNVNAILFLSNALILRNFWYTTNQAGLQYFISQNISEVPSYMRESYKVNLPIFIKLFTEIIRFGEFITNFMTETTSNIENLQYTRKQSIGTIKDSEIPGLAGLLGLNNLKDNGTTATTADDVINIRTFIDNIIYASKSIKDTCERVLREVAEDSIYLQIENDYFTRYHAANHHYPVSLVSFSSYVLNSKSSRILDPIKDFGSPTFKYNYGIRGVLLDTCSMSSMPFNKELVDGFNESVPSNDHISLTEYESFVHHTINITKYFANMKLYRFNPFAIDISNIDASLPTTTAISMYSAETGINNIINLIMSINIKADIDTFLKPFSQSIKTESVLAKTSNLKKIKWKTNFIDLNMIPFNPSALMREIPLANLYNYNYTFEKIMDSYLNINSNINHLVISQLIKNPYADKIKYIPNDYNAISNMFEGYNTDLGLGRPKYLSDQIYNKVLLQNIYPPTGSLNIMTAPVSAIVDSATLTADKTGKSIIQLPEYSKSTASSSSISLANEFDWTKNNEILTYPFIDNKLTVVKSINANIDLSGGDKLSAKILEGKETVNRFNTAIVRNLVFSTNVYRVLRSKLETDLVKRHNIVTSSDVLVDPSTMEYFNNQLDSDSDYTLGITKALKK